METVGEVREKQREKEETGGRKEREWKREEVIHVYLQNGRGYCYDAATCQTYVTVSGQGQVMLKITLALTPTLTLTYPTATYV